MCRNSDITNYVILHHMYVGQLDMLKKSMVGVGVVGNRAVGQGGC